MAQTRGPAWCRFINSISRILGFVAGLTALLLVLLNAQEVGRRYLLRNPSLWAFEITEYMLLFVGFVAFAYALQEDAHVAVDLVYQRLPRLTRRILDIVTSLLILLFGVVFTWQVVRLGIDFLVTRTRTGTLLEIPMIYMAIVIFAGSAALCLQALVRLYDSTMRLVRRDADTGSPAS